MGEPGIVSMRSPVSGAAAGFVLRVAGGGNHQRPSTMFRLPPDFGARAAKDRLPARGSQMRKRSVRASILADIGVDLAASRAELESCRQQMRKRDAIVRSVVANCDRKFARSLNCGRGR